MYDWPEVRSETDHLWEILRQSFVEHGCDAPQNLMRSEDEVDCWSSDALFFSQTCGYPYSQFPVGQATLLGTPHFDIEGWNGPYYSSAILVNVASQLSELSDSRDGRFAFNGSNSMSGVKCLTPMIGDALNWFSNSICSGAHRSSATMVANGEAEICAVDAYCWYLYQRFEPEYAAQLRVAEWTPQKPALPYITRGSMPDEQVAVMRKAIAVGMGKASLEPQLGVLKLNGSSYLGDNVYATLKAL